MNKIPIIDLHQDLLLHIKNKSQCVNKNQTDWESLVVQNFKVTVVTAFVVPPNEDWTNSISNKMIESELQEYLQEIDKRKEFILIKNKYDLNYVFANDDLRGIILHVEGLNNFQDLPEYWEMLERWYALGWRSLGIVWNVANSLAGGTNTPKKGLTILGEKVIKWAISKNMIIDFAHMNRKTFQQVAQIINQPIYVSHGGVDMLTPSLRNYTDEQLLMIADSGGMIGVFFSNNFLRKDSVSDTTIDDVVAHIDYIKNLIGVNYIALGTDFGGFLGPTIDDLGGVDEIDNIIVALRKKGYNDDTITKICYQNAQKYFEQVLG